VNKEHRDGEKSPAEESFELRRMPRYEGPLSRAAYKESSVHVVAVFVEAAMNCRHEMRRSAASGGDVKKKGNEADKELGIFGRG